jgi:hypothetical protein
MTASTRWLAIVGGVTVALVVVSLVVAQIAGREVELDLATPEGTVQAYLRAVAEGDSTSAYAYYSPALQARCDISYLRDSLRFRSTSFRASLGEVTERGDTVEVRISITEIYGSGPFGRSESRFEQLFILEETEAGWRFAEAPWPSWCPVPIEPRGAALGGGEWA